MTALVISFAASWGMIGVIWMVQLLQYPMLATHSELAPATAAQEHQRRITWIVGPLMLAEGVTALFLLARRPETMSWLSAWAAAFLLGVALLSTIALQVPLHTRLGQGHDAEAARKLISTNWVRTVAWTARGLVLAAVLVTT